MNQRPGIIVLDNTFAPYCSVDGSDTIVMRSERRARCVVCAAGGWIGLRPLGHPARGHVA